MKMQKGATMRVFLCPLAAGLTIFSATAYAGALGNEPAQVAAPAPDFGGAALYFTCTAERYFFPTLPPTFPLTTPASST